MFEEDDASKNIKDRLEMQKNRNGIFPFVEYIPSVYTVIRWYSQGLVPRLPTRDTKIHWCSNPLYKKALYCIAGEIRDQGKE